MDLNYFVVSTPQMQQFFLALSRILAILVQIPVLGGNTIPTQVRLGFGILTTMLIFPWQALPTNTPTLPVVIFGLEIGREIMIGTIAGFTATLLFSVFQIAGEMMDLTSGFAAARLINPAFENAGSPLNQLFYMTAIVIFLATNGHHSFLLGVQKTFVLLPLNTSPGFSDHQLNSLASLTSGLITAGVQMSLPLASTMLLTDLALGLLARVAPQIQVFFLGIPLKVGLGLLVLSMALAFLTPAIRELFRSSAAQTSASAWMLKLLQP